MKRFVVKHSLGRSKEAGSLSFLCHEVMVTLRLERNASHVDGGKGTRMDNMHRCRHMRRYILDQYGCNRRQSQHHEESLHDAVRRSFRVPAGGGGANGGVDLDPIVHG